MCQCEAAAAAGQPEFELAGISRFELNNAPLRVHLSNEFAAFSIVKLAAPCEFVTFVVAFGQPIAIVFLIDLMYVDLSVFTVVHPCQGIAKLTRLQS